MTYTILPNSGQSLGVTRIPINTNFSIIQSVFDKNHIDFNATSGPGKHKLIQFPIVQASSPGTAAGEVALYTKNVTGAVPEIFFQPQSTAADGTDIQLTANIIPAVFVPTYNPASVSGAAVTGSAFVTFLPGNLIMISGFATGTNGTGSVQQITFPFNITVVWSVQITRFTQNGPSSRYFPTVISLTTSPGSITIDSRDDGGVQRSGFSYYYNVVTSLP